MDQRSVSPRRPAARPLGKGGPASGYGAAGSILAVLVWSYYCAQILYFGAEFTRVYSQRRPLWDRRRDQR